MIKATIKIGNMNLTFEAQTMKDVFKWSGVYSNLPKACDACNSENLYLSHRTTKAKDDYFELKCSDCNAAGSFGQHKEGGTLYWKWDTKMEVFVPSKQGPSKPSQQGSDDLPF